MEMNKKIIQQLKDLDQKINKLEIQKDKIINENNLCRHCYKSSDRDVPECKSCHEMFVGMLG